MGPGGIVGNPSTPVKYRVRIPAAAGLAAGYLPVDLHGSAPSISYSSPEFVR
jgi:hypothetical protein